METDLSTQGIADTSDELLSGYARPKEASDERRSALPRSFNLLRTRGRALLLLLLVLPFLLSAQADSAVFNADFRFNDGVYFSHAALLANQPDLGWEAIDGEMVQLPEDYRVQIAHYGYKDVRTNPDIIPYAISLDGLAYLFVRRNPDRNFHEFTGLRVRGKLSTIRYDTIVTTRQLMKAYNPANGRPFRQAYVERDKKIVLNKILHLPSGTLVPFNRHNLAILCADDDKLPAAIRETEEGNYEMLLRALRLYDDRHPFKIPLGGSD